ncbi:MAG: radical SAM family heme chaperone HemW [Deltaproteobacteria bacterium]|nr:radical SAM family heme chaperone HemW [Deltaproteobacteria bacterium]
MERPISIYVHIPFCASKCWYCDFASVARPDMPEDAYVRAVEAELRARRGELTGSVPSVFFGGGTPSLFSPASIARILDAVRDVADLSGDVEITLEANPGTVNEEKLAGFRAAGVNRLSFGVQSLRQPVLSSLGREHGPGEAREAAFAAQRAGYDNFNMDFMYAVPERRGGVCDELDELVALGLHHLSAYCLTVYEGTPREDQVRRGRRPEMDPDASAAEFDAVRARLRDAGFEHYELANFARPGKRSRHNIHYWQRGDCVGVGAAAVSFRGRGDDAPYGRRRANIRDADAYIDAVRRECSAAASEERPSLGEAVGERLFLGLRMLEGVSLAALRDEFGLDVRERYAREFDDLVAAGLIAFDADHLRLSEKGLFLSDEVFQRFV